MKTFFRKKGRNLWRLVDDSRGIYESRHTAEAWAAAAAATKERWRPRFSTHALITFFLAHNSSRTRRAAFPQR
jgi:hypothetical protein